MKRKLLDLLNQKKKVDGVYSKIIYPDGSIAPARTLFPDFDKVDEMKVNE